MTFNKKLFQIETDFQHLLSFIVCYNRENIYASILL